MPTTNVIHDPPIPVTPVGQITVRVGAGIDSTEVVVRYTNSTRTHALRTLAIAYERIAAELEAPPESREAESERWQRG